MPTSPVVVGLIRGVIEAALIAALEVVAAAVLGADLGPYAAAAPLIVYAIRQGEAIVDQRVDPTKQRGPLGGAPHQGGGL